MSTEKIINPYAFPGLQCAPGNTPKSILEHICELTGTDMEEVVSKSRRREFVVIRQLYCYIAHRNTNLSYREIGEIIHRDHATVMFSITRATDLIETKDRAIMAVWGKCRYLLNTY